MRILLDTHSFLWFIAGDARISTTARALVADGDNEALLSIASLWEIAIKLSLGKLTLTEPFETLIPGQLALNAISVLPIEFTDVVEVGKLPFHHRDPFDRLLVAQAVTRNLPVVSRDRALDSYAIRRLW